MDAVEYTVPLLYRFPCKLRRINMRVHIIYVIIVNKWVAICAHDVHCPHDEEEAIILHEVHR